MKSPEPKHNEQIQLALKTLPGKPGVYQFYDEQGRIIYIGKAKNLKKRVASYFNRDHYDSGKVKVMVKRIAEIRHIIVDSELDALLLENNLIKKYQPRYNIMLKDDKTYPWICIKNEPFPRIFTTRNVVRDGSKYFGPYASGKMMHALLDLIRQLFQYRTCRLNLSPENIRAGKFKVCLEYHLGNCLGPCEGLQSPEDYQETMDQIEQIIKGNLVEVKAQLKEKMKAYAGAFEFEKAQMVKQKIEMLEHYQSKSTVVSMSVTNVDVFSVISDQESGYVNFMKVINGAVVQSHTLEVRKKLDETDAELLELAIVELRQRFQSQAVESVVPFKPSIPVPGLRFTIPQRGDKKKLLELSERNAKYFRLEKLKQKELVDPERHTRRILKRMQEDLHLPSAPAYIECFDNSNTQGTYPVAAMVVFRDARPSKKDYRHFNIKTVEGPDDFASMEEVVARRYKRLLAEGQPLPDLVVIDGGKGQLSAAVEALESLGLRGKVPVIGIAKRLEEIYFPGDSIPIYIDKKSETLKVIQHLRDEAHRFGITHHRKRREKGSLKSQLADIKGIGPQTEQILLNTFKSVAGIKRATDEALEKAVGLAKANIIKAFFKE
ncbi:MAG: excinuclease ABC subunit UvrC [Bacteroides sp.]|jgi:excinuclease ABC subunit C|nr:excinuclease ABC subunit UvrC [Bacteroides sp.]